MKRFLLIALFTICMVMGSTAVVSASTSGTITKAIGYDCVYFGQYPQTEIVNTAEASGCYGKKWESEGDYEVDEMTYDLLKAASWDSNGDTEIDGIKYHRLRQTSASHADPTDSNYYGWQDSTSFHYFRYEPIKWRVLKQTDTSAYLMADLVLDTRKYNGSLKAITWEKSSLRTWLNGSFVERAFNEGELSAIRTTNVINKNNIKYNTPGGNTTSDKVFILSESNIYGDTAYQMGFDSLYSYFDETRTAKSSTYAKATGVETVSNDEDSMGNCCWWLRSPGYDSTRCVLINSIGFVSRQGDDATDTDRGIRPVICLNTSKTAYYSDAGTTGVLKTKAYSAINISASKYPYKGEAVRPAVTINELTKGVDYKVSYVNNSQIGTAAVVATGIGNCSGEIKKTYSIVEYKDVATLNLKLKTTSYTYNGTYRKPALTTTALVKGTDYTISYSNNKNVGTATVTVKGINCYKGTKKLTFKINPKGTYITDLNRSKKAFTVKWNRQSQTMSQYRITGYKIRYSLNSSMSNAKTVTVAGYSSTYTKIKNLQRKKKYYVQVRTYKKIGSKTYYSDWSAAKNVTTR